MVAAIQGAPTGIVGVLHFASLPYNFLLFAALWRVPQRTVVAAALAAARRFSLQRLAEDGDQLCLVASLLLIVAFSGYENFISKTHTEDHEDRPEWMGKVDFSGLKLKLVASIVAISGIELLKGFVNTGGYSNAVLAWKVGIHGLLVATRVLLAWMDRIAAPAKH